MFTFLFLLAFFNFFVLRVTHNQIKIHARIQFSTTTMKSNIWPFYTQMWWKKSSSERIKKLFINANLFFYSLWCMHIVCSLFVNIKKICQLLPSFSSYFSFFLYLFHKCIAHHQAQPTGKNDFIYWMACLLMYDQNWALWPRAMAIKMCMLSRQWMVSWSPFSWIYAFRFKRFELVEVGKVNCGKEMCWWLKYGELI